MTTNAENSSPAASGRFLHDLVLLLDREALSRIWMIAALALLVAFLDVFSLSLIAPLVIAVLTPEYLPASGIGKFFASVRGDLAPRQWLMLLSVGIVAAYLFKGALIYFAGRVTANFSERQRISLMLRLMRGYYAQPYEFHLVRDSSSLVTAVVELTFRFCGGVLSPLIRIITDAVVLGAILVLLILTDPHAVAVLAALMGFVAFAYFRIVRHLLHSLGARQTTGWTRVLRAVSEGLGSTKESKVLGVGTYFIDRVEREAMGLAEVNAKVQALLVVPRFLVEMALISFLIGFALLAVGTSQPASEVAATIGIFAVAGMRILPTLNGIVAATQSIRITRPAMIALREDLSRIDGMPVAVDQQLMRPLGSGAVVFDDVSYRYPRSDEYAVRGASFELREGEALGVIGRSGSGKSTLADLCLGLLTPTSGRILAEGRDIRSAMPDWQARLACIPQSIFLLDDTVRRNVAFGVPDDRIDEGRLSRAIERASLKSTIEKLPKGLDAPLGERGIRLSGGQKQRIAIARALYHDRKVLVMDEATAALDVETEREVVNAIRELHGQVTMVIIAHRHSTIRYCDRVISVDDGRVSEIAAPGSLHTGVAPAG